MAQLTPMMQQYLEIKEGCKDCILFFRLGDFYEMFFEDAEIASRELELVLTGRDCGLEKRAPMCGVPYHAAESYIGKLVGRGYKVAICEQLEDPALAKGIVKRDIIRVITPGTITDLNILDEKKNNYIMSICKSGDYYGVSYCDVSTGDFYTGEFFNSNLQKIIDEVSRVNPSEIICNNEFISQEKLIKHFAERYNVKISSFKEEAFEYSRCVKKVIDTFKNMGKKSPLTLAISSSGALLSYIEEAQKTSLSHINILQVYSTDDFMMLDNASRRNLELTETMRNHSRKGSLLWVLDKTITAMGARTLRRWIEEPLLSKEKIVERLDGVEELKNNIYVRSVLGEEFKGIYDIERLVGKIVYGNVNARDLISLKHSLAALPKIKDTLGECSSKILQDVYNNIDTLQDVFSLIEKSIIDNPPVSVTEGSIIKDGYDEDVDKFRTASREGKKWIANLESSEREATGIRSLKIGYNKVFGYYIEITNANKGLVPEDRYIRKQTLSNAERYITPELKEVESTILGAEEKVVDLEYKLFCGIRETICSQVERLKRVSHAIGTLDTLNALSKVAEQYDYVKPVITEDGVIRIKGGRHPVIERTLSDGMFVPNDTYLDMEENRISIITGPNMAGKSTYMRQVALIVIMAQIGSFVPAEAAEITIVDRVFTRIGASDDLSSGQSTFMVEMSEVAQILKNATPKSLILLDEVGRGTSTYDGLSIAWAVIEYISDRSKVGAKTLFATHYHELTELEGKIEGIKNYCISVKEHGEDIIFLRKIIRGGADRSYGIQVAKLAGLPQEIIENSKKIMNKLEQNDIVKRNENDLVEEVAADVQVEEGIQLGLFDFSISNIVKELKKIDILNMTPMEAMNTLYKLVKEASKL